MISRRRSRANALYRSPDNSDIKKKMVYASSKDALRRSLVGIAIDIQGTDFDEVAHETSQCHLPPLSPSDGSLCCNSLG